MQILLRHLLLCHLADPSCDFLQCVPTVSVIRMLERMDVALIWVAIKRLIEVASLVFVIGCGQLIPQTSHRAVAAQHVQHGSSDRPLPTAGEVHRATLDNGMRVIVIRNPLAPVVTVEQNYIVGGNETPAGFPGMAHAQEHMAFRGCYGLTADQIAAVFAQLGGFGNADTQQNITNISLPSPQPTSRLHSASTLRVCGAWTIHSRNGLKRREPLNRR